MGAKVKLPTFHPGQVAAYHMSRRGPHNPLGLLALRAGRRWGKTDFLSTIAVDGATKGEPIGWFAPSYKILSEAYQQVSLMLDPVTVSASKIDGVIRTTKGGRIDWWTLNDERAGRSRMYKKVLVDEGAFTDPNMLDIWEKSIAPTLLDLDGTAIVASNTNGIDPNNFLWQIAAGPRKQELGFVDFHAPTSGNPYVPRRRPGETEEQHAKRRLETIEGLRLRNDPLVFAQEYLAEFVDWAGVAFFSKDKLLGPDGDGVPWPNFVEAVYATVDTSIKAGKKHDGTAVTYWGYTSIPEPRLWVLDWDYVQFEGASLEVWLKTVFHRLDEIKNSTKCRFGSNGVYIEDQNVGTILIQKSVTEQWPAQACPSELTAMGKDNRAINISGHVFQNKVKFTKAAYDKTVRFKGDDMNHQIHQVTQFRIGDPDAAKRADDLLDTFTYGVALGLGSDTGMA